jgi:putative endonuclease
LTLFPYFVIMAHHNETGAWGEKLAVDYLTGNNFTIVDQNWRYSHWEIDVIASRNEILHFIEVKTRRSLKFGYPEEAVTKTKMEYLIKATEEYLYQHPVWERIQIDILSILLEKNKSPEFFFIEDVTLPGN